MVQAEHRFVVNEETRAIQADLEDFEMLETGDVDVLVLDLNELDGTPPFYIEVDGRRFALQRDTFQVRGHGAQFPAFVHQEEAEGRLVLLAERDDRFLVYVHDPAAEDEGEAE